MKLVIKGCESIKAEIEVGGDKSITHRGLILGAIAEDETILFNYSRGGDCISTMECLRGLGIDIHETESTLVVKGKTRFGLEEPENVLDCGNSGTTMRILMGVLSAQNFFSVLAGDASLRRRPMGRIIEPLTMMGAVIRGRSKNNYAPLAIEGRRLKSITYTMPVSSAQVKSAILLAGLYAEGTTIVEEQIPTRDHTERMLEYFGLKIAYNGKRIILSGDQKLTGRRIEIPGDISSAAFFMVLASVKEGNEILIKNLGINPNRTGIIAALAMMGAEIIQVGEHVKGNEPVADIRIRNKNLKAIELSGNMIPRLIDEIPILAVAATHARGVTIIKNAMELRVKETDRIKAIVEQLSKMGAKIEQRQDGFIVEGPVRLHAAHCQSYGDHRIAMALAIAGLIADGETIIDDCECIKTSFPEFIALIRQVCGDRSITVQD